MPDGCTFRRFKPGDREAFVSLYRRVLNGDGTPSWFDWKYVENPFTDEVPIGVGSLDGTMVAAYAYWVFEFTAEGETYTGAHPTDVMVHPDFQQQGVMSELAGSVEGVDADFLYAFPNENSDPLGRKFGFQEVGRLPIAVRIDDLPAVLARRSPALASPIVETAVDPAWRAYTVIRDRVRRPTPRPDLTVDRYGSTPVEDLLAIERSSPSPGFQIARDRRFYEWRYRKPTREYEFYVARDGTGPVAAVIARLDSPGASRRITVVDVLPRRGDASGTLAHAIEALLAAQPDAERIRTLATESLRSVLRTHRFWRKDRWPLSEYASTRPLLVLASNDSLASALADWDRWDIGLIEQDLH